MSEKQQRLVLSIIDFLDQSIQDGTVKQDDKEGLEIAVQCIGEAFGVDPSNEEQINRLSVKPATLPTIFDVFLKTRDRLGSGSQSIPAHPAPVEPPKPSSEDKAQAEKFKQEGNALMSSKQYDRAIEAYDKAIDLDPLNPIYYSNRAAAHSSKGDHLSAVGDAEKAIEVDTNFMAQQMMANGGMEQLMSNPSVANMMERVRSGGGMPSMEELMTDPTLSGLASQFGAGAGAP
ncbi:hypothetical protein EWM64_g3825 [Hericium alpestre]|uniref:SGTA homodimerisation domain-containing protein n=1 Tax=Hericium alpestre TaxID=135208 RepID=A0A4Z0A1M1_9AGAM|nr:hypothetical protein EWM64_g3825 [Hericium alpestre]